MDALRRLWIRLFSQHYTPSASQLCDHIAVGKLGEKLAADHLISQHCHILKRDFKSRKGGQVDLVVRDSETLVFVEIKTRTSQDFQRAFYAVSENQKKRIKQSAGEWMRQLAPQTPPLRFDIIEVYLEAHQKPKFYWFKDAF